MGSTRTDVRQRILDDWPWLGFYATADSIGDRSIVHESLFGHDRYETDEYQGRWVNRYNLTGTDRLRQALSLDTTAGELSVDGNEDYIDQSDDDYEITGLNPDEINAAIQDGQRRNVDRTATPLGFGEDSDMELSGTDYWDGTSGSSAKSNVTVAKGTDATDVYSGSQALIVTLTADAGYVRGRTLRVTPGRQVLVGIIARADIGKLTFRVYDTTNAQLISGVSVSYSGEDFAYIELRFTPPSGCEEIQYEVAGESSANRIAVDSCFGPYIAGRRRFPVKSQFKDAFQIKAVRPSDFGSPISADSGSGTVTVGVYDAFARVWLGDYLQPADFSLETFSRDVSHHVVFSQSVSDEELLRPLWLVGERPLSDKEPLDSESATTTHDLEEVVRFAKAEIAQLLHDRHPSEDFFTSLFNETRIAVVAERLARPPAPRIPRQEYRRLRA